MQSLFFEENKNVLYGFQWDLMQSHDGQPSVDSLLDICSQYIVLDSATTLKTIKVVPKEICYK